MTIADIRDQHPEYDPAFPSNWRLPTAEELAALQSKYGCTYPPSFVEFQLHEARNTPMGDRAFDGFGWANCDLEPYLNLDSVLSAARQMGVPQHLSPFRNDESNFFCFDTRYDDESGEFPVVFWDHDEGQVLDVAHYRWDNFLAWLSATFEEDE